MGYLMLKALFLKNSWYDKGVHTFSKGICPKVNVIARLEFELAYNDFAVHCFNHYTTRPPLLIKLCTSINVEMVWVEKLFVWYLIVLIDIFDLVSVIIQSKIKLPF